MRPKTLLCFISTSLFCLLFCSKSFSQTCCKVPDSLKVVSVTDTSFKVSWHVTDSIPCDTIIGATVQWRKVGTTIWSSATVTYGASKNITFTDTAGDCTLYQWQVRNECKHGTTIYYSSYVSGTNFATYCKATCCRVPDSLKVVSLHDSAFCLSWRVKDSLACDSIAYGTVQYKKLGATTWTTVNVTYSGRRGTISFCDTATECARYVWQVSNVCVYKDTTINSGYVSGPGFTMQCPLQPAVATSALQLYPNPAQNSIKLTGTFATEESSIAIITDVYGNRRLVKQLPRIGKTINSTIDITALPKGMYFVTVTSGKNSSKATFLKGK